MSNSPQNILIVAAHPDDEVLGCGGTIARHVDCGDNVFILIAAEGATSRGMIRNTESFSDTLSILKNAANNSARILGASQIEFLDFPDNRLDTVPLLDLIKQIEIKIDTFRPHTVYVHHSGDVNIDHQRLHEAVVTACRPVPGHSVSRLLSYEVPSSTEWQPPGSKPSFQPNWFVDVSAYWDKKISSLREYSCEMRPWPHPRSIESVEHLARWRGSQVGVHAAEAFYLLRNIA